MGAKKKTIVAGIDLCPPWAQRSPHIKWVSFLHKKAAVPWDLQLIHLYIEFYPILCVVLYDLILLDVVPKFIFPCADADDEVRTVLFRDH